MSEPPKPTHLIHYPGCAWYCGVPARPQTSYSCACLSPRPARGGRVCRDCGATVDEADMPVKAKRR